MKTNKILYKIFLVILFLTMCKVELCLAMGFFQSGYLMRSYKGKVIDRDTKKPVEGVAVAGIYQEGYMSIAGSGTFDFDAQESLTDAKGEFVISERFVESKKYKGQKVADLVAFKPGYKMVYIDNYHLWERKKSLPGDIDAVFELIKLSEKDDLSRNVVLGIDEMKSRLYVLSQYLDQQNIEAGIVPHNLLNFWLYKGLIRPGDKTILDSHYGLFRGTHIIMTQTHSSSVQMQYSKTAANKKPSLISIDSSAPVSMTKIHSIHYENNLEQNEFIKELTNSNNIFTVTKDNSVEFFEENKDNIFKIMAKIDKKPRIFFLNKEYADLFMTLLRENDIPFLCRTKPNMIGYDIVWNYIDNLKVEKSKLKFFNYVIKSNKQQGNK
jgi:hypothetical protein